MRNSDRCLSGAVLPKVVDLPYGLGIEMCGPLISPAGENGVMGPDSSG